MPPATAGNGVFYGTDPVLTGPPSPLIIQNEVFQILEALNCTWFELKYGDLGCTGMLSLKSIER